MKQMLPRSVDADMPDVGRLGIEACGNGLIGQTVTAHLSNLDDISVGQFGEMGRHPSVRPLAVSGAPRMPLVFEWGCIFEVVNSVVVSDAIEMVDVVPDWAWADEGISDQDMNKPEFLPSASDQLTASVTVAVVDRFKKSLCYTTNVPEVAHFVMSTSAHNWSPLFGHVVVKYNTDSFAAPSGR